MTDTTPASLATLYLIAVILTSIGLAALIEWIGRHWRGRHDRAAARDADTLAEILATIRRETTR